MLNPVGFSPYIFYLSTVYMRYTLNSTIIIIVKYQILLKTCINYKIINIIKFSTIL